MVENLTDMQLNNTQQLLDDACRVDLIRQLPLWVIIQSGTVFKLERAFSFHDFTEAMAYANHVAKLAEENNHHPSLLIEWGEVTVTWWTHSLGGLHQNDFIMAARCDRLYEG